MKRGERAIELLVETLDEPINQELRDKITLFLRDVRSEERPQELFISDWSQWE